MTVSSKPKLFLVPAYTGSLKYFARFWPRLREDYDAEFLFVRGPDRRREQMVAYAQQQGLPFRVLDQGLARATWRLPVLTSLWKHFRHIRACRRFIRETLPAKVILMKTLPPHDTIVREAARLGTDVIILQWSFHSSDPVFVSEVKGADPGFLGHRFIYFKLTTVLLWLLDFIFVGPRYLKAHRLPAKIGVFDEQAAEGYAAGYGFPRDRISVVGMADSQIVSELNQRLGADSIERCRLEHKYRLSSGQTRILIIAHGFHLRSWTGKTIDYQLAYYGQMITHLRSIVPEATILLKLHPSDSPSFYRQFESLGVAVYGDEAQTDELICLSDLVVSGIWTTANYMVTASGRPAIFENFTPWPKRNIPMMRHYHIKQVVTDWPTFDKLLAQWQGGTMPDQYDKHLVRRNAIDGVVRLIGKSADR